MSLTSNPNRTKRLELYTVDGKLTIVVASYLPSRHVGLRRFACTLGPLRQPLRGHSKAVTSLFRNRQL